MPQATTAQIDTQFDVNVNLDWSFTESKSTQHLTHGYHRYPAKFIPQLVSKLIEAHTVVGDKIVDVFAGCGTTLVESKAHGRRSIGVDINPVAQLITKAKINAINPERLTKRTHELLKCIEDYDPRRSYIKSTHARLDYWFPEEEKNKIAFLYEKVLEVRNEKMKIFFLCGLSNILKNCSRWLQSSTKPQVDPNKILSDPFKSFEIQIKRMSKKNLEFFQALTKNQASNVPCEIKLADARATKIRSNSANAIISSPPYVTSYEYADIHQLTAYWFEYISDICAFRKNFIGTFYSNNKNLSIAIPIAQDIVDQINVIDKKKAGEVANYFIDMMEVAKEMHRILIPNGIVCLVIGNTTMKDIKVKSAEAFAQMLISCGFTIDEVIKREIPCKLIPTIRDKNTGKFSRLDSTNKKLVYPDEYIIIARK